jgi:folate-binding protein YgfZ
MSGPRHYGDPDSEYGAFTDGAALVDSSDRTRIEHAGSDALDLLHRLTTNDLLGLEQGKARRTVVTTGDARVIDLLTVVNRPSQPLLLLGGPSTGKRLLEWLDQYTFGEDSAPADVTGSTAQFTIAGPAALRTLADAAKLERVDLAPDSYARLAIAGHQVDLVRTDALGAGTVELIVPAALGADVWRALTHAGATPAGTLAYDALRVARGVPEYGRELDERVNPHEANLVGSVSFTKGCYVGQEVVARLDTYDKVQRRLVGVRSENELTYGTTVLAEGRPAGEVRTVAETGPVAGHAALAYVRRGHWEPGAELELEGGGTARVVAFPLN